MNGLSHVSWLPRVPWFGNLRLQKQCAEQKFNREIFSLAFCCGNDTSGLSGFLCVGSRLPFLIISVLVGFVSGNQLRRYNWIHKRLKWAQCVVNEALSSNAKKKWNAFEWTTVAVTKLQTTQTKARAQNTQCPSCVSNSTLRLGPFRSFILCKRTWPGTEHH